MIDGESEGDDCHEVICTREVNQEDSEQNGVGGMKKGADSTGKVKWSHVYDGVTWWFELMLIKDANVVC